MTGAEVRPLSTRQSRALALIAQGWTFAEIGAHLKIGRASCRERVYVLV